MDGHYGVDSGTLPSQLVDIHSEHFYPIDLQKLSRDVAATTAAGKPLYVGEYSWTVGIATVDPFLSAIESSAVVGSAYWSFFPVRNRVSYARIGLPSSVC